MPKKLPDTLAHQIYDTLAKSAVPLKAMDISSRLKVKRALVNRALYGKLNKVVSQDDDFCWEVIAPFCLNNDHFVSKIDVISDEQLANAHQALLGSTIDVVYLSGPSKGKESRLTLIASDEAQQVDIEHNSIPTRLNSPIGAAIFKQTLGEIVEYRINDTSAAVLIKSISIPTNTEAKTSQKDFEVMPKTTYQSKPIKVYENETHFLVEICAKQKERASNIPKRRWNRHITAWVYPKTAELYDALKAEFEKDADVFDIKRPQVSRVSKASQVSVEEMKAQIEEAQKRKAEKLKNAEDKLDLQFNAVMDKLEGLTRHVEKIEDTNDEMQDLLLEQVSHTEKLSKSHKTESEFEVVNDQSLELTLMMIAFEASGRDESFMLYLEPYHPITRPERFITRTHEFLQKELSKVAGLEYNSHLRFHEIVYHLRGSELLNNDKRIDVYHTLNALNAYRDVIAHPKKDLSDSELKSYAISYLMSLAYIWDEVASEPV